MSRSPAYYALAIKCPGCGAPPGKPCRSMTRGKIAGKRMRFPHVSRLAPRVWDKKLAGRKVDPRGPGIIGSHWIEPSAEALARPRNAVTSAAPPAVDTPADRAAS